MTSVSSLNVSLNTQRKVRGMENGTDFFAKYLAYAGGTEVPNFFNRWAAIASLGAWMGQDAWVQIGTKRVFPNLYVMLVGDPGSRKSTAIKQFVKLLARAGYDHFSAEKTSKEKFLIDLASGIRGGEDNFLDKDIFGNTDTGGTYTPVMIAADEFNDFFSNNIFEFVSTLGVLWDYDSPKPYKVSVKHGDSPLIQNPNISILAGNTTATLCRTFPPETIGQGFFSRLIFVYHERTGERITFPPEKSEEDKDALVKEMQKLKVKLDGRYKLSPGSLKLLDKIYKTYRGVDDVRFTSYDERRFDHLLKLTQIHAFADFSSTIEEHHVIRANTVLIRTEHTMPKALGHFGLSRNSELIHKLMDILDKASRPVEFSELISYLAGDISRVTELGEILKNLHMAEKIMYVDGGILIKRAQFQDKYKDLVDWNYLTPEERLI